MLAAALFITMANSISRWRYKPKKFDELEASIKTLLPQLLEKRKYTAYTDVLYRYADINVITYQ